MNETRAFKIYHIVACEHRWHGRIGICAKAMLFPGRSGHECCQTINHRGPHKCWCNAKQKRRR